MQSHINKGQNKLTLETGCKYYQKLLTGMEMEHCTAHVEVSLKSQRPCCNIKQSAKIVISFEAAQMLLPNKDPITEVNNFNY